MFDLDPMSRQSIARLAGNDNDLLVEEDQSFNFNHLENRGEGNRGGRDAQASKTEAVEFDEAIDETLINEIEDYLKGVMENNEKVIDMSDSPIGSAGAKCVATAIMFCEGLEEMRLSNCGIGDKGALSLFNELLGCHSVTHVDLSGNPLSEKCFDVLAKLLQTNSSIKLVKLLGTATKSKFAY